MSDAEIVEALTSWMLTARLLHVTDFGELPHDPPHYEWCQRALALHHAPLPLRVDLDAANRAADSIAFGGETPN